MKLIKTPTKGMNDYLPGETALREYVKNIISEGYAASGFSRIETPSVEHIENLTGKNGGDNEKLIFRIMKRGEELARAEESGADLCDSGLRYDLTVPLARYYANNASKLPSPFLAMQIGNVWRADRPQKGRFRQFTQCDIDILGDSSPLAEITLISTTAGVLGKLGFGSFTIRINDRRLLKAAAAYSGFDSESYDRVFIILDKLDKIGIDGVRNELLESGFDPDAVRRMTGLYGGEGNADLFGFAGRIGGEETARIARDLDTVMKASAAAAGGGFSIVFDPSLVRGMSYYTGTIFEITMDGYGYSVGGGGRYDEMLGKFTGQNVPACGFSLGFERIVGALSDMGYKVPGREDDAVLLAEKGLSEGKTLEMLSDAARLRSEGKRVLVTAKMKNYGFQKRQLEAEGYSDFRVYSDN